MSRLIGIIGGSGLQSLPDLQDIRHERRDTAYGAPSSPLSFGMLDDRPVVFLPRHGHGHTVPPHRINYRANIRALKDAGVSAIIGVAAVGGITAAARPGRIVIASQLIDYTYGREHTFFDGTDGVVRHIDFTSPFDEGLRQGLIAAAIDCGLDAAGGGIYGVTQGPRLETAAEIDRMARDGCDLVGMTALPEASLARELDIPYASCCIVANWAAGRGDAVITMDEIERNLATGMEGVLGLLACALPRLPI